MHQENITVDNKVVHLDDDDFETLVIQSDKPVLVDFWADWCQPCHAMAPTVEALAEEYGDRIRIAKLDVDANAPVSVAAAEATAAEAGSGGMSLAAAAALAAAAFARGPALHGTGGLPPWSSAAAAGDASALLEAAFATNKFPGPGKELSSADTALNAGGTGSGGSGMSFSR